jgi:hypothetical protein
MDAKLVECACGCGTLFEAKDKYNRPRKYISGHNGRKYKDLGQYKREWNHRNREARYLYKKKYLKALKEKLILHKGGSCQDCQYKFNGTNHTVFDLHHLEPHEKNIEVSKLIGNRAWETVLIEAEKCVLICANCHRLRHSKEEDEKIQKVEDVGVIDPKKPRKMWKSEDDVFILTHTLEESIESLGRSESSIESRLKRLKNHKARNFKDESKPNIISG